MSANMISHYRTMAAIQKVERNIRMEHARIHPRPLRDHIVRIARAHNHLMVRSLAEAKQYAVQS